VLVWIVYFEVEPGFIGVFDVRKDAEEFMETRALDTGRAVLLSPVPIPNRDTDRVFTVTLDDGSAADS
jgi:hypothetical protein